jgi:hypothetical protein
LRQYLERSYSLSQIPTIISSNNKPRYSCQLRFCPDKNNANHVFITASSAPANADATNATGSSKLASETSSSTAPNSESNPSQAWIAGAVIGPIAGVAIIAGFVAWIMARRKRKQSLPPQQQTAESLLTQQPAPGSWQQQPALVYVPPQHPPQELDTGKLPQELDTGKLPQELDAGGYPR